MIARESVESIAKEQGIEGSEWWRAFSPKLHVLLDKAPFSSKPFRISEFRFHRFSSPEYCGVTKAVGGGSCLIWGEHRTGKSTTYDAFLFALAGKKGPLREEFGKYSLELDLSNGSDKISIMREYQKGLTVKCEGNAYQGDEATSILEQRLGIHPDDFLILRAMTLPQRSETDSLFLRASQPRELQQIVLSIGADRRRSSILKLLEEEFREVENELTRNTAQTTDMMAQREETKDRIGFTEYHIKEMKDFSSKYESGELREIVNIVNKQPEVEKELRELENAFEELWKEDAQLRKRIGVAGLRYKDKKPEEVVQDVLSRIVCPICEHGIDLTKMENRLQGLTRCPMCNESYSWELLKKAEAKIEEAKNIANWRKRLGEITLEKTRIEKRKKDLGIKCSHETVRRIVRNGCKESDFKEIIGRIERAESLLASDSDSVKTQSRNIKELKDERRDLDNRMIVIQSLKDRTVKPTELAEVIRSLMDNMNKHYTAITASSTRLEYKEGEIYLVEDYGGFISSRNANDRYNVSVGERRALDASFLLSVLALNQERRYSNIEFAILDDPSEGILGSWKGNLIALLGEASRSFQLICTTYDDALNKAGFENKAALMKQIKLPQFIEPSPSTASS
jgi:hypothetical protein